MLIASLTSSITSFISIPVAVFRYPFVPRNSAAAIVGTLVYELAQEAIAGLVHVHRLKTYLLFAQLAGWQGLFRTPTDWTQITRAIWISALFAAVPLAAAFWLFLRRDVAGD